MRILFIITFSIVCQCGLAQYEHLDKLAEDLIKPPSIDSALTNLPPMKSEPTHPEFLPSFKSQNKPKVITKQNKDEWNLPFTLDCMRQGKESAFFRLTISHEDKLNHFSHADLYSGSTAHDLGDAFSERRLLPDRKAIMRLLVPMHEIYNKESTNKTSMGSFQVPVQLAEQTSLRLLCKENKGPSYMKLNVYVINLQSFVPEVRTRQDSLPSTNETININIEI